MDLVCSSKGFNVFAQGYVFVCVASTNDMILGLGKKVGECGRKNSGKGRKLRWKELGSCYFGESCSDTEGGPPI